MPSPVINQSSPDEALTTVYCTRCKRYHGGEGWVVTKLTLNSGAVVGRYIEQVGSVEAPKHSYCIECAEVRKGELEKKDRKSTLRRQVKEQKQNLHNDDCTLVATALGTGLGYDRVLHYASKVAKIYTPNKGGLCVWQWEPMLRWAAAKRGKQVHTLQTVYDTGARRRGPTANEFAASHPKGSYVVSVKGHAFPIIDGKAHNASAADGRKRLQNIFAIR